MEFDLAGDALVTSPDRDFWMAGLAGMLPGDTDFDCQVQFNDLQALSANFGSGRRLG